MDGSASMADMLGKDYSYDGVGVSIPQYKDYEAYGEDNFIQEIKNSDLYKRLIESNCPKIVTKPGAQNAFFFTRHVWSYRHHPYLVANFCRCLLLNVVHRKRRGCR